MLIGIDASRANKDKKTGVEWYSYHLIEEFKKMDKDNHYFLYTDKPLKGDLAKCPPNFEEKVLKWPLPRFWTLGRLSWEMLIGKKPDVLFVPAHTIPLVNPKKTVVTVHDIGFEHFPDLYKWPDKLYHKFTIRFIKKFADQILTVSDYSKQDVSKFYKIKSDKIQVVYNGYDSYKYKVLDESERLIKDKYILFIGRLEEKKNTARLVEAFINYCTQEGKSELKLVLIGRPGYGFEKIENLIKVRGFEDRVILPGWVEDDQLPVYLNQAEAFIFPSLFEGFGIPVLEAMACGCPVVCSNTTSLPEAAGEAAIMIDPRDVGAITDSIAKIVGNTELQEQLRTKGLDRVKDFSWHKCARETLDIVTRNR
jgi:glycosyltransferase involved in cell wall biosynthesis